MVILQPVRMRWIRDAADDPTDPCAHGDVEFLIGEDVLLYTNGRAVTVSAAALYLLRTLSVPHTRASPVGDHLFPCCGIPIGDTQGQDDVDLGGCPNGEDFEVHRRESGARVAICASDGREWTMDGVEWRAAVFAFADRVSAFYAASSPKHLAEEDAAGFEKFRAEWKRRRGESLGQTCRCT